MAWLENLRLDVEEAARGLRLARRILALRPDGEFTAADALEASARRGPKRIALRFEERKLSYRELDEEANRFARWARRRGVGRGAVVGLRMENRPEYVIACFGLAKLGAVGALVNTQLAGVPLAHSLRVARAKQLVVGAELAERCGDALAQLKETPRVWAQGGATAGAEDFDAAVAAESAAPLEPDVRRGLRASDNLFYIYTSGTTGLPKAANFSHHRFLVMAAGFGDATDLTPDDCTYVPLPLYHSAGLAAATGTALVAGASVALARRFSASRFWTDCVAHEATVFQYIGELCRYLLASPAHADERRHRLRVAIGNGLRADVWPAFQQRFRIPRIVEFYGATEGNVSLVNTRGKVGAVGRMPWAMRKLTGTRIVRFDVEREEVVRGADGRCMECKRGGRAVRCDGPARAREVRGLLGRGRERAQDPARRVRARRRLLPQRRPAALRRRGVLLLRRPHRRHLPLEGRERRHG
jgi:fatty-acyl-CoA synthase